MRINVVSRSMAAAVFLLLASTDHPLAQTVQWRVSRISGEAWLSSASQSSVPLAADMDLVPGSNLRTGRNGRVMLTKGEEIAMIAPNSALIIPEGPSDGMRTNLIQQAGSVTIQAEKRDQNHFEVQTPFLAAVVKGTRFTVNVDARGARVDVASGRVEVSDFRSGQIALVLPSQAASVSARATVGLRLSGTGPFNPVNQGASRATPVQPLTVPRGGFRSASATNVESRGQSLASALQNGSGTSPQVIRQGSMVRILAPVGQVKLDIATASDRLARNGSNQVAASATARAGFGRQVESASNQPGRNKTSTIWANDELSPSNGASKGFAAMSGNTAASVTSAGATSSSGSGSSSSGSSGSSASSAANTTAAAAGAAAAAAANSTAQNILLTINNGLALALGHYKK